MANNDIESKVDEIITGNKEVKKQLNRRTAWFIVACIVFTILLVRIQSVGNNLIDCTTPGTKSNKALSGQIITGHKCWDRLHAPTPGTSDAVAAIVDDLYCDQRRAQAKLPAVPNPKDLCRNQTDPKIYPGQPN